MMDFILDLMNYVMNVNQIASYVLTVLLVLNVHLHTTYHQESVLNIHQIVLN